ncbi:MAG: hypothetical protein ACPLKV_01245 [Minisyncoccia bacterium]
MIRSNFLKIWAVWERIPKPQDILERIKSGALQGVHFDPLKARLKVPCVVVERGIVKPWVFLPQLGQPQWFQISLSVPGPKGWAVVVGENKLITPHFNNKVGKWLLLFRNGTVVRFHGRKLVADYLGVARQGNHYSLLERERVMIDIPHYVRDKESLRDFLVGQVDEEILKVSVELFESDRRLPNPKWEAGLKKVPIPTRPPQLIRPQPPEPASPASPSPSKNKKIKEKRRVVEARRGKELPLRAADEVEKNPRGLSLRDFQEEN